MPTRFGHPGLAVLVQTCLTVDRGSRTRPISLLVADDSASLRALVRITVTSQGWAVTEAETAGAARDLARSMLPDLMLLDVGFGETGPDGLAVCAELKADPATAAIPIVVLTAHDDPAERDRAHAAHADAFVGKPFGPLELMRILHDLVPASPAPPALGVYLLDAGAVEPTVLEHALSEQRELSHRGTSKQIGDVLLERGLVSGPALDRALLEQARARAERVEGQRTRVLIVDDHAAVREGLKSLMREDPELEVVGEAADAEEGLRLARRHRPDIIVLDNEMHGRSGLALIPDLRAEVPSARIVMFSLESTVREQAIAAGAHTFITKDAPMGQILEALRPTRRAAPQTSSDAYVPAFAGDRRWRHAAALMAAILGSYVVLFFILESAFGASAGVFSVIPVVAVGALLGSGAGAIAGALTVILNATLWNVTGHGVGEPILEVGGPGFGIVLLLLLGFGVGTMRDLRLRLDPRRSRVDAVADAARALAGIERIELVDVLLASILRVIPADLALLYANAAGEARFVAASRALQGSAVQGLATLAREAMRAANARVITDVPESERPIADARYALIVPASLAGREADGALVLASARPFADQDVARVRPFANYFWLVLRTASASDPTVAPAQKRELGLVGRRRPPL